MDLSLWVWTMAVRYYVDRSFGQPWGRDDIRIPTGTYESTERLAVPFHVWQNHEPGLRIRVFVNDLVRLLLVLENVVEPVIRKFFSSLAQSGTRRCLDGRRWTRHWILLGGKLSM